MLRPSAGSFITAQEYKRFLPHQIRETRQSGGGKIMLLGFMTYYGVGDAAWAQWKIDSEAHVNECVVVSRDWYSMDPEKFIFQQNNANIHTARIGLVAAKCS